MTDRQGALTSKSLYRRTSAMRLAKILGTVLICSAVTIALLELSLPLLHGRYAAHFRRSIDVASLRPEEARRLFAAKGFDPDLGWDRDPIARNYVATKRYLAQSYGDSYVEGAEVGAEDTWQAHFERLTGQAILNLGVGGYGLDQAVLKFEKYGRQYPTRIAILGLYHQPYRRALSYHPFYYFSNKDAYTFAFKPVFVKNHDRFELLRPPCATPACVVEVLSQPDHEVWRRLAKYDHWYRVNQERPVPGFPNTITYARVLPERLRVWREQQGADNYFFPSAGSLEVIEYIIERFVNDSRAMGMTPLCLLLYAASDLRLIKAGVRFDDKLLAFLADRAIPHVDTARYILDQHRNDDSFGGLQAPKGHLNARGNRLVAEALASGLASVGLPRQ
jgi:hypothetical protein